MKNEKFWNEQAVYGKYYDGKTPYWRTGLRLGKEFVSESGRYCLTSIMKKYNYEAGKFYSCKEFVSRLRDEIGVDVMVTFRRADEGFRYLNEIHILHDTELEKMCYQPTKLDYEDEDAFYLEDLESRFGTTKNEGEMLDSNEEIPNEVMQAADQDKIEATHKRNQGHKKGKGKRTGLFSIFRKYKLCLGK